MRIQQHITWIKVVIHAISLGYLFVYYYWALNDSLGADPVKAIIHFTGIGALNLLLITLTLSPLTRIFKQPAILKLRRLVGLYSFTYALLHFANYVVFDLQLAFNTLFDDILKRPYITVGFSALLILIALALTSPKFMQKRLGKRWFKLHKSVYACCLLVCIHFIWSVKSLDPEPIIYITLAAIVLSFRVKFIESKLLKK